MLQRLAWLVTVDDGLHLALDHIDDPTDGVDGAVGALRKNGVGEIAVKREGIDTEDVGSKGRRRVAFEGVVEIDQQLSIHRIARRIIDGAIEGMIGLAPGPAGIDLGEEHVA